MVQSKAPTVAAYLKELPPDRRKEIAAVRRMVRAHLPKGYRETMRDGMIACEVPLTLFAETCNGLPLCYAALAGFRHRPARRSVPGQIGAVSCGSSFASLRFGGPTCACTKS